MKEVDIILGRFADAHLASLDAAELDSFEHLLAHADPELYKWLTGREPVPQPVDSPMFRRVQASCGPKAERP